MEPECLAEKQYLFKLIKKYKVLLQKVAKAKNLQLEQSEEIKKLKEIYEETQAKLVDSDYFLCLLGKNFESECTEEDSEGIVFYEEHEVEYQNELTEQEEEN